MDFVNAGEFFRGAAKLKEEEKVLPWGDLPIGKIYRIERYETLESSKFASPCYLVHLIDKTDSRVKVWGSKKLIRHLEQKLPKQVPYIASVGKQQISGNREVNGFDLHMKDIDKDYLIQ